MLPSRASQGRKGAVGESRDLRTRRVATVAKVMRPRMLSKTFYGSYSYSQNPRVSLEFFMHTQIRQKAAANNRLVTSGLKPGTTGHYKQVAME
jgi:hypothetical protein